MRWFALHDSCRLDAHADPRPREGSAKGRVGRPLSASVGKGRLVRGSDFGEVVGRICGDDPCEHDILQPSPTGAANGVSDDREATANLGASRGALGHSAADVYGVADTHRSRHAGAVTPVRRWAHRHTCSEHFGRAGAGGTGDTHSRRRRSSARAPSRALLAVMGRQLRNLRPQN